VIPPSLVTDQVTRLTGQLTDFFRSATDTFAGIKDTASAEAAVPKLRELSTTLDTMRVAMNQLPSDARAKLVALVQELSTKLMQTLDSVTAIPAVGDTIKPFVDELRSKLHAMGAA
jgi:flagellar hook-associated protein FlgK